MMPELNEQIKQYVNSFLESLNIPQTIEKHLAENVDLFVREKLNNINDQVNSKINKHVDEQNKNLSNFFEEQREHHKKVLNQNELMRVRVFEHMDKIEHSIGEDDT